MSGNWIGAKCELRHNAKIAAAAAQRPEEVFVLVRAGLDVLPSASTTSASRRLSIVKPQQRGQVADAAAEGESPDTGRGNDSARHREPVLVCCVRLPRAHVQAAADANGPRSGSTDDGVRKREIDHNAVLDAAEPAAVVATATYRDRQIMRRAKRSHSQRRRRSHSARSPPDAVDIALNSARASP